MNLAPRHEPRPPTPAPPEPNPVHRRERNTQFSSVHFIQNLRRRDRNARVIPLRQPLHFLRREKPGLIPQCKLQRIHNVIPDDLGRIFVGDNRVKGFECAHGAGDQDEGWQKCW